MIALVLPVFAQNATVERVSGKVEYMAARGRWTAARVGDTIPIGATISTGFRSSAVLSVSGSEITVMALTRMSIEDLAETNDSITTSLNLRTGRVRASVRSTSRKSTNFTLRSPVSTAAVRGTEFIFSGYRLDVINGAVTFLNLLNEGKIILGGNGSESNGFEALTDPEDFQKKGSKVITNFTGVLEKPQFTGSIIEGEVVIYVGS
jgi:hypothetical protein